jgi:hypothetical protein
MIEPFLRNCTITRLPMFPISSFCLYCLSCDLASEITGEKCRIPSNCRVFGKFLSSFEMIDSLDKFLNPIRRLLHVGLNQFTKSENREDSVKLCVFCF